MTKEEMYKDIKDKLKQFEQGSALGLIYKISDILAFLENYNLEGNEPAAYKTIHDNIFNTCFDLKYGEEYIRAYDLMSLLRVAFGITEEGFEAMQNILNGRNIRESLQLIK